jgi:hypothetical protein
MRWTVLPNGRADEISCVSEELKSSYMAQCLTRLIKGWRFPRSNIAGEPITFPFKF